MTHALIIGGTGMLRDVTLYLLNKFDKVSVIARSSDKFKKLEEDAGNLSKSINKLQLDYSNYNDLTALLIKSIKDFGEITLVVSWVHSTAPLAPVLTAKVINDTSSKCDFYEVLGSAFANPENQYEERKEKFSDFEKIIYHKIILGFILESGSNRWLRNEEISSGVISAIENRNENHIVGTIEPWSSRP